MYDPDKEIPEGPSKSQRKRDMTALQKLGAELTELTPAALKKCGLPEVLQEAIDEYHRLPNKHGAHRRQLQYIGKVMRDLDDSDIAHITDQIDKSGQSAALEKRRFMALEELRTGLLAGDANSARLLQQEHPDVDMEQVQQLIDKAREEQAAKQTPLASRKLFQLLRQIYQV